MVLSNTQATKHMNKESFEFFHLRIADLHNKRRIADLHNNGLAANEKIELYIKA